jgi:two-component system sensor histidine kinase RegB
VSVPAERESAVTLHVPRRALAQALRAVLKNEIEASRPGASIALQARLDEGACRIEVRDQGVGMTPEVLAHAGEPFFTTKGPDRGMGLGLFLVRAVVERLGGDLMLRSAPESGTKVVVRIPTGTPAARSPVAAAQEAA